MKAALCVMAALLALGGSADAADQTFPEQDGQVLFTTPSGNIGCVYTPEGGAPHYQPADGGPELQCDRVEPTYLRFILSRNAAPTHVGNVGDQGCCSAGNTLHYGSSWNAGPFTCESARIGLTCNRDDGHGFFISRAKTDVY